MARAYCKQTNAVWQIRKIKGILYDKQPKTAKDKFKKDWNEIDNRIKDCNISLEDLFSQYMHYNLA
ncbi:MAG: hypothetical protein J6S61_05885, partial [Elusimicrobiaceae bacterium]|nr:hypothetical protein [Elusimicrobiaceae bacterium]